MPDPLFLKPPYKNVVYSHNKYAKIHIYIYMLKGSQRHNDKGRAKTSLERICTSHFIVRVRKRFLRVLLWEGVEDRTELQYIDPHSYGRQHCVFLVLQGYSTGGPGAQLSAECWLFYHILSPTGLVPKLHRGSPGPLRPGVAFSTTSCLRRLWSPTLWLLTQSGPWGPLRPGVAFPTTSRL